MVYTRGTEGRRSTGQGGRGSVTPGSPLHSLSRRPPGVAPIRGRAPNSGMGRLRGTSARGRRRALGGRGYRAETAYLRLGCGSRRSHSAGVVPLVSSPQTSPQSRLSPAAPRRLGNRGEGAGPGSMGWGTEATLSRFRSRRHTHPGNGQDQACRNGEQALPLRGAVPGKPMAETE